MSSSKSTKSISDWDILHALPFPSRDPLIERMTRRSNSPTLMFDLRNYNNLKPTKTGVAVHLPELKWIKKVLDKNMEDWIFPQLIIDF